MDKKKFSGTFWSRLPNLLSIGGMAKIDFGKHFSKIYNIFTTSQRRKTFLVLNESWESEVSFTQYFCQIFKKFWVLENEGWKIKPIIYHRRICVTITIKVRSCHVLFNEPSFAEICSAILYLGVTRLIQLIEYFAPVCQKRNPYQTMVLVEEL